MMLSQKITAAATAVNSIIKQPLDCAIILGSGLSSAFKDLAVETNINYADIPHLPVPKITSHPGQLNVISANGARVALCCGRIHLYEGYSAQEVAFMTYLMSALGAKTLIVTNAAGALNPNYQPGQIMLISDHINMTGHNPILGQGDEIGQRFTDMSQAYSPILGNRVLEKMKSESIHSGVYGGVLGPSLETSAERRMLTSIGADAVGMSTIMEVIAAKHCKMDVLGISAITNMATGDAHQAPDTIDDILKNAAIAAKGIRKITDSIFSND